MNQMKDLGILFIGNSHTYFNDMPLLVKHRAEEEGYRCRVTMLAHPDWYLSQHAEERKPASISCTAGMTMSSSRSTRIPSPRKKKSWMPPSPWIR